ncbi:SH3 domain-containing protein [Zhengella sp. ZM62]|uniref:SH3 domain-containing protein n=1 Tax=Zhengella sedimenti TaxID=3390035 RepID=UPI003974B0CD
MSEFAGNWAKQRLEQEQRSQTAGFGLAGFVATGAVLAVLAGFGAIAVVAGGSPKGSGTVVTAASPAKAAMPAPVADAGAAAGKTAGGETHANSLTPGRVSAAGALAMAQAESQAMAPAPVRTYKVATDGRVMKDDYSALAADDPRWAQDAGSSATKGKQALARLLLENEGAPEASRDNPLTSAIAPVERRLESTPQEDVAPARAGKTGYASQHVNMRAGPSNGAKVIEVIPAKARVTIHGCKGWCEISHEGRRGFVYKSFIRQG